MEEEALLDLSVDSVEAHPEAEELAESGKKQINHRLTPVVLFLEKRKRVSQGDSGEGDLAYESIGDDLE